jgi:hypothetical protein
MTLDLARTVADAVLYEGYLLYPYRATSQKNQARWQFGVLGPPGAAEAGLGEESTMSVECLLSRAAGIAHRDDLSRPTVAVYLRFLQLQHRDLECLDPADPGRYVATNALRVDDDLLLSWDEAVDHELTWPSLSFDQLADGVRQAVTVASAEDVEPVTAADGTLVGRIVRRRWPLRAEVTAETSEVAGYLRLRITVENTAPAVPRSKDEAVQSSLLGAHLLLEASGTRFVSLLEPPDAAAASAAAACNQSRCWPVMAGPPGTDTVVLASPIILYDHPEVAPESAGALFDSTEIDEILTLRVMTMTEAEKAEARATDPRAREIIDRCDEMTPEMLQQLHGILREPRSASDATTDQAWLDTGGAAWWDPAVDESVRPDVDAVVIMGVSVRKGSRVRLHPSRRADAQDLFLADRDARVTAVLSDVDGDVHVAVVLLDDPAADLHDWYGRYLYFAPDELEPLTDPAAAG